MPLFPFRNLTAGWRGWMEALGSGRPCGQAVAAGMDHQVAPLGFLSHLLAGQQVSSSSRADSGTQMSPSSGPVHLLITQCTPRSLQALQLPGLEHKRRDHGRGHCRLQKEVLLPAVLGSPGHNP